MNLNQRSFFFFFLALVISTSFFPVAVFSQTHIKGRVIYEKDNLPAAFASVQLINLKIGELTDQSGSFSLRIPRERKDDTLQISMVGYETLKMPVTAALGKKEFVLSEKAGKLANVTVKAFSTHDVQGSTVESVGYYRSWNTEKTGGEIGRIFHLPYNEYKLDKVRFKVNNMCDSCRIRLHIREVENGVPGDEILADSISTSINQLMIDDKAPEFNLTEYDLTLNKKNIFVSLEVLNCGNKIPGECSFAFAGSEPGEYIYKTRGDNDWKIIINDYTIYLKLFLRH